MKIALVGNQNSGKTTLFNLLTGTNAKIGNWPGVTIEKKSGIIKGTKHELVDLPGIYSLSPYSVEEEVSRNYIFQEELDIIINIIDSTSLERSLYLTTQLLELDIPVIMVLNMMDMLEKKGAKLDIDKLEKRIGCRAIRISALKGDGVGELINELNTYQSIQCKEIYDNNIETAINFIQKLIFNNVKHKRFISVKLIEKDSRFNSFETNEIKKQIEKLEKNYDADLEEIIATQRYNYIEEIKNAAQTKTIKKETLSDKLDKIFLNKYLAFPIFTIIMFLVYYLSVGVAGSYTITGLESVMGKLSNSLEIILINLGVSNWLISLIIDGIITGIGAVLNFIPQLVILFLCISLLETTGYMSRIALLLDRVFRKIGLSGKSVIPFIIGSGCSVPAIMGTRIIENQDEREMTAILTPFIPCSAKLPIIALFSGYFFGANSGIVSASLYFLAIAIIIFCSIIMKKFIYKNTSVTYIAELPEYKLPSIKYILRDVWDKVFSFIKRAGSVILICSIIIWFMLSFSYSLEYGVDIENSILANIGKTISWVFYPMLGINSWEAAVSVIQGLVAKEQVISSMSIIAGFSKEAGSNLFTDSTFSFFTASSAYAFMVFNLFSAPCFGAIGAIKRELVETKKVIKVITFQIVFAWTLASIIYQIGYRIENNLISIIDIISISTIIAIILLILKSNNTTRKEECRSCPYCSSCNK